MHAHRHVHFIVNMTQRSYADHGYAWVILGACFFMYMLLLGSIKSFGILYSEILLTTDNGAGSTALIGSSAGFIQSLTGPFSIFLAVRFSFRSVCLLGGVFLCLGYVTSALIHNVLYWYLTYSVIAGFGYGLAYVPCTTLINYYFERNRALANGIVLSASGVGGFLFPHIYRFLLDRYALNGAMIILGGIMLNICVAASFLRQPLEFTESQSSTTKTGKSQEVPKTCRELVFRKFCVCGSDVLRDLRFLFISMAFCLTALSYSAYFYTFPSFLESENVGKSTTVFIFSLTGVCEIFARVAMGWFTDLRILSPTCIYGICMVVSGVATLVVPLLHQTTIYYIYAVIVGIFPGSFYALMSVIILETIALKNLPSAFAIITIFIAVFSLLGIPCLGWIEDLTKSWDNVFFITGVLQLLAAMVAFSVSRCFDTNTSDNDIVIEQGKAEAADDKLLGGEKEAGIE